MNPRAFWSLIPQGVRGLLVIAIIVYVASAAGEIFGAFNLRHHLALNAPAFWKGSFWQLLTHPFLPQSLTDFLVNGFLLITLGPRLEQNWSRHQFWSFCFISALGAGLAKVLFASHSPISFAGFSGIIFGLLAAWLKLFGHEEILLLGFWKMSVRLAFLIAIIFSLLFGFFQTGVSIDTFVPIFGGLVGWIYLTLRWKRNLAEPAKLKTSDRIARLEL